MACHEVDYEILGSDMQIVEIELDQGETVVAEAGAMNSMEDGIEFLPPGAVRRSLSRGFGALAPAAGGRAKDKSFDHESSGGRT